MSVYVFGSNSHGQIGLGTVERAAQPKVLISKPVRSVSMGGKHMAVVTGAWWRGEGARPWLMGLG